MDVHRQLSSKLFSTSLTRRCHLANINAVYSRANSTSDADKMAPIVTRLTDREREVATLVGNGLPNKTVAQKLNVSEGTVKAHLHHIFQKLGVQGRSELAVLVIRG